MNKLPLIFKDQSAVQLDDTRGALWQKSYLRSDATALSLVLLSMSITSSFHRMAIYVVPPAVMEVCHISIRMSIVQICF